MLLWGSARFSWTILLLFCFLGFSHVFCLCWVLSSRSSLTVKSAYLQFHTIFVITVTTTTTQNPTMWKICWISHWICVLLVFRQTHGCMLGNLCNELVFFLRALALIFNSQYLNSSFIALFSSYFGLVVAGDKKSFLPLLFCHFLILQSTPVFSRSSSGLQHKPGLI